MRTGGPNSFMYLIIMHKIFIKLSEILMNIHILSGYSKRYVKIGSIYILSENKMHSEIISIAFTKRSA